MLLWLVLPILLTDVHYNGHFETPPPPSYNNKKKVYIQKLPQDNIGCKEYICLPISLIFLPLCINDLPLVSNVLRLYTWSCMPMTVLTLFCNMDNNVDEFVIK